MDAIITPAGRLKGTCEVPADKSICHRAILCGALSEGPTRVSPWPDGDDCRRTLEAVQQFGIAVRQEAGGALLEGRGSWQPAPGPVNCGESGTTYRLLLGLLAGQPFETVLSAAPSLMRRPMRRVTEPLSRMGASFSGSATGGEVYPPISVRGTRPLRAIDYPMPVASAQVKSALLLAGLFADGPTTVVEPVETRDHTERVLAAFGVPVKREGRRITVTPSVLRSPGRLPVPGDFSSAAFFLVAACCVPGSDVRISNVSLNPTRAGLLAVLERMGARFDVAVEDGGWEPRGTIRATARTLRGMTVEPDDVPAIIDELPILMVAAACAEGVSVLRGLGELRLKETDRIASMAAGLTQLGARVKLPTDDSMEIEGGALRGGDVDSAGDHRTAMSLAVAGLAARGPTTVRRAECVAKSFPDFFVRLGRLAGPGVVYAS